MLRKVRIVSSLFFLLSWAATGLSVAAAADSEPLNLEQYRGQVVVLDFWASWCGPCRKSFPWLNQMQAKYADQGLVIIGINVDAERDAANRFLQKYPSQFRIVYDPDGGFASQYEIVGMPSSVILDRQGKVVNSHQGFREKKREHYENIIKQYLQ